MEHLYRLRGDMDPVAQLAVTVQDDGDVVLSVLNDNGFNTIEFCTPGTGGGKSPHTHAALRLLANAMRLDSATEK